MDKKFSARNRDKIVKSLKYYIDKQLPNFNGSTNELKELIFEKSRAIHTQEPGLDIKDFNKRVLRASFSDIKNRRNIPATNQLQTTTQPQGYIPVQPSQDSTPLKLVKDEPLEDPMKELQRLQSSRNMMDNELNQSAGQRQKQEHDEENRPSSQEPSLQFLNNSETEGTSELESLFSTILPPDYSEAKEQNESIKSISIQDQTFRRRKTQQMDNDEIRQIRPAKNREQELIIPRTIQQGYYDKEHTLVVYGLDRNWTNMEENRYNFNLKFQAKDSVNTIRGQGTAKTNDTFRNIVGMQITSLILPNENLSSMTEAITRRDGSTPPEFLTTRPLNALQYPYVNIDIGSFNGEIQGTNQHLDRSFGNMKYDTGIRARDSNAPDGFLSFIPTDKSHKRIFYPTPLANLKSMNISIRNPFGDLLSEDKDCVEVDKIYLTNTDLSAECPGGPSLADLSGSMPYIEINSPVTEARSFGYLAIKTSSFFREGYIRTGDIIRFDGVSVPEDVSSLPAITGTLDTSTSIAFETFINRPEGHYVLDIGHYENVDYDSLETGGLISGGNVLGYANFIIIQLDADDPTSGSITRKLFGSSEAQDYLLHQHLSLYSQTANPCLVNTSKQIEIVFKIFTRNYDGSELKPQNI
jgi:hypothetical protein